MRGESILNNIVSDDRGDNILYFNIDDREKMQDATETGNEKDGVDCEEKQRK